MGLVFHSQLAYMGLTFSVRSPAFICSFVFFTYAWCIYGSGIFC